MPVFAVEQALGTPPDQVGVLLLDLAEDQWFDRKSFRVRPRELGDALIGFGNADGGTIAVGLSAGVVEGTDRSIDHRNALMQAAIDFSQPPVRARSRLLPCRRDDGSSDHLLLFEIEPGDTVHANVRDEVFLRIGDENRRLSFAQRQELMFDRGQVSFEGRSLGGTSLDQVDPDLLDQYSDALGHAEPARLLEARGLARNGQLTIAGCLLFGRYPQRFLPEAFVRVVRYRGRERGAGARQQIVSDAKIEGPIPRQLSDARALIQSEQPKRRALTGSGVFDDVPLVPEDAWLEGLVNAAVHRSYSLSGDHIRVEIFEDRIEVESPGRFPGLVNPADPVNAPRYARNPRIARVCSDQNFGQELGEGIRRMFEEMRLAGLGDPIYRQTQASVRLTLSAEPADRELEARLPSEARAIIAALRAGGRLSTGEVAEVLGASRVTAGQRLKTLQQVGLVVWKGKSATDPRAYWALPPTDEALL